MADPAPNLIVRCAIFIRSLIGWPLAILYTGLMSVVTVLIALTGWTQAVDSSIQLWARGLLKFFNVHLVLHDWENVPKDRGVLFLFNHQSDFDIPCLHALPRPRVRFGAKAELFKIPVFGAAMRAAGTLPIVREDRGEVFRVYREAQKKFAEKWTYALAPEGTRQARPEIGNFKKGPFIFAVNAQAPIVPVVLEGTYDILPKGSWLPNLKAWRKDVHIRFLPPIETAGLKVEDVHRITRETHDQMVKAFAALRR